MDEVYRIVKDTQFYIMNLAHDKCGKW